MLQDSSYRPALPDFGVYTHWPVQGCGWIHPHDIGTALRLIPSRRVFERLRFDGSYYYLRYGNHRLRVRPSMWLRVPEVDVRVGDRVELLSGFGRFDPGIATVTEVLFNSSRQSFEFVMRRGAMVLPQRLGREQFRLLSRRYRLRSSHVSQQPPRFCPPADIELLNVGDLG